MLATNHKKYGEDWLYKGFSSLYGWKQIYTFFFDFFVRIWELWHERLTVYYILFQAETFITKNIWW